MVVEHHAVRADAEHEAGRDFPVPAELMSQTLRDEGAEAKERRDLTILRLGPQFLDVFTLENLTVVDDRDGIGHLERFLLIVGNVDGGGLGLLEDACEIIGETTAEAAVER